MKKKYSIEVDGFDDITTPEEFEATLALLASQKSLKVSLESSRIFKVVDGEVYKVFYRNEEGDEDVMDCVLHETDRHLGFYEIECLLLGGRLIPDFIIKENEYEINSNYDCDYVLQLNSNEVISIERIAYDLRSYLGLKGKEKHIAFKDLKSGDKFSFVNGKREGEFVLTDMGDIFIRLSDGCSVRINNISDEKVRILNE